jgi:uncharacterized protein
MHDSSASIVKKQTVISLLRQHRNVVIALSGGVDSATLLAMACEALGREKVLAITGRSASVTDDDLRDASRIAQSLNVRHEIVDTREMERAEYRANAGDRCFHCRSELFEVLSKIALERGFEAIAYGAIADDLGDDRPGMDAATRLGIRAPLLEAGIGKSDVRTLASSFDLYVRDKPASACLASRIPMGTEVTLERLTQVGRAESALRTLGFLQVRVRHHGDIARIELGEGESDRLADPGVRAQVVRSIKDAGFRFAVLDLEGYRPGGVGPQRAGVGLYSIAPSRGGGQ